jgi:hypothetical protein
MDGSGESSSVQAWKGRLRMKIPQRHSDPARAREPEGVLVSLAGVTAVSGTPAPGGAAVSGPNPRRPEMWYVIFLMLGVVLGSLVTFWRCEAR